jgi:hypothetical protein
MSVNNKPAHPSTFTGQNQTQQLIPPRLDPRRKGDHSINECRPTRPENNRDKNEKKQKGYALYKWDLVRVPDRPQAGCGECFEDGKLLGGELISIRGSGYRRGG